MEVPKEFKTLAKVALAGTKKKTGMFNLVPSFINGKSVMNSSNYP